MMEMEKQTIEKVVCPTSGKELNAVWLDSMSRAWTTNDPGGTGQRLHVVTKMTDLIFDTKNGTGYQHTSWSRLIRLTVSRDGKEYDVAIPVKTTFHNLLASSKSKHYTYVMTESNTGSLEQTNLGYTDLYSNSPSSDSPLLEDYLKPYGLVDGEIYFRDGVAKVIALHGYYNCSYINFLGSLANPKRIIYVSDSIRKFPFMYDLESYVTEEGQTSTGQKGLTKPCVNEQGVRYLPTLYYDARKYKFNGKKTWNYIKLEVLG